MNNYLLNKYNIEEIDIPKLVFVHNHNNTYKQIYVKSEGIDKTLILTFITILIFMGFHPIFDYENF